MARNNQSQGVSSLPQGPWLVGREGRDLAPSADGTGSLLQFRTSAPPARGESQALRIERGQAVKMEECDGPPPGRFGSPSGLGMPGDDVARRGQEVRRRLAPQFVPGRV